MVQLGQMTMLSRSTPPSSRTAKTRSALLSAGRKLFAARPIDAVAVDDIVSEALVAKGTFYNHFEDKEALLYAIVSEIRSGIEGRVTAVNAGIEDPPARIARAICVYVVSASDDPAEGQILLRNDLRSSSSMPLNDGLEADLAAGLHSGRLVIPSIDAGLLYVIGVAHSLLLAAVRYRDLSRAMIAAQQLCMLMLRSFGLSNHEAEMIASQAADSIIRRRAFEDGSSSG